MSKEKTGMKALVKIDKGKDLLEVKTVPIPKPRGGEALVRVKAGGICGTDIHIRHDEFPYFPPVILGHEFAGEIADLGPGVEGWQVGARVVGEPHFKACGVCELCRGGYSQICPEKRSPGYGTDGCFAEYIRVPVALLHQVPAEVSLKSAALAEPFAVVIHEAVERGGIRAGDRVVVFGSGPIGLLSAAMARVSGAAQVILVGTDRDMAYRFSVAEKIPVDGIINASREEVFPTVDQMTEGHLADLVIEASGAPQAVVQAIEVIKKRGRITAIGLTGDRPVPIPWDRAMLKVADLHFNFSSSHSAWKRAIALMASGRIDPGFVVSHEFPLEAWEKGFDLAERGEGLKVLLVP
jgi:L-iditol 2-dehydrogenase